MIDTNNKHLLLSLVERDAVSCQSFLILNLLVLGQHHFGYQYVHPGRAEHERTHTSFGAEPSAWLCHLHQYIAICNAI